MRVKAQRLQYEMRKIKERDERKQNLDMKIYPVVSVGTKPPLVHVEVLTKSIASRQSSLFCEHNHGHLDPDFH